MRTRTSKLLLLLSLIVSLVSCQKEVNFQPGTGIVPGGTSGGGNVGSIVGNYDFVGLSAHTQSTVTVTDQGQELKSVTTSDYVSKDNSGTVEITSNEFISTGLGYSIDTMMNVKTYINNILSSDLDFPFVFTTPLTTSVSPYVRNSDDSVTVTGAFGVSDPTGGTPTGPVGMKISWSGDILVFHIKTSYSQTVTQGGIPGNIVGVLDGTFKLKKR